VAEAGDVAVVTATLGTGRGLEPGIVAIAIDEVGSVGKRETSMNEYAVHDRPLPAGLFRDCRQIASTNR
jgi:hypothetical protein